VKALIGTRTFLWMAVAPENLPLRAREICETSELVFSVASLLGKTTVHRISLLPRSPDPPGKLWRYTRERHAESPAIRSYTPKRRDERAT
jgi:PIN domain nuclease of toxin-antitoxin system